jgi:hypothetical protein
MRAAAQSSQSAWGNAAGTSSPPPCDRLKDQVQPGMFITISVIVITMTPQRLLQSFRNAYQDPFGFIAPESTLQLSANFGE